VNGRSNEVGMWWLLDVVELEIMKLLSMEKSDGNDDELDIYEFP
jgi:hypothetical protein